MLIFVGRMVKESKVHEGKDYGLNGNGLNNYVTLHPGENGQLNKTNYG